MSSLDGSERIKVSLDVSAVPLQPVGAGRYIIDLARAASETGEADMTLLSRRGDGDRWKAMAGETWSGDDGQPSSGAASTHGSRWAVRPVVPDSRQARLVWEQVRMASQLRRSGVDVHHSPHYTMPARSPVPVVVTIHDLTFVDHPQWHESWKVPVFRRAIRVASRNACAIVCVSQATADRLNEVCRPRGRVFVAPHGIDHDRFFPDRTKRALDRAPSSGAFEAAADLTRATDMALLAQLGVRAPYVCFVGTLEPRKAVPQLVKAFDLLAPAHPQVGLVLAGGRGWGATEVQLAVDQSPCRDRIAVTGYVTDAAVPALLRQAEVVAYPALEEGFGLPVLEALACGTPVVTTAGSVMDQVACGAAATFPAGDISMLAKVIGAALSGGPVTEQRVSDGLAVATKATWEASARQHLEAYRYAARSSR